MKDSFLLVLTLLYIQNTQAMEFTAETTIEINPGNAPIKIILSEDEISKATNGLYQATYPLSIGTTLLLISIPILCDKTTNYIEKKTNLKNVNFYSMLGLGITYALLGCYLVTHREQLTTSLIKMQQ